MDRNRETGQLIEAQRRALAEAVVARQYELQPGLRQRYGDGGRAKCVQDTEYHLSYLAAAVTDSSPALFSDYIAWAKAVLAAFGDDYAAYQQSGVPFYLPVPSRSSQEPTEVIAALPAAEGSLQGSV